jgi:hypothetical protein
MPERFALQRAAPNPADEAKRQALAARVLEREAELDALKVELQKLQSRYLDEIGALYRELNDLEAEIADIEIRAGLREPPADVTGDEDEGETEDEPDVQCSSRGQPTDELKRMFRDVAKTIHPDLAADGPARYRRHSLMAEANRAYAERDADRLRLILHAWQNDPDAIGSDEPDAVRRRITRLEQQLAVIDVEFAELRGSAIYKLKAKLDTTRAEGWDLFAEMTLQVKSEVGRARTKLARLNQQFGIRKR